MVNQARHEDAVAPFDRTAPVSRGASLPQSDSCDPAQGEVRAAAGGAPSSSWSERRAFEGWRAELGIPELFLVARYVRRPFGLKRLREQLVELQWPEDEARDAALIISRIAELACRGSQLGG